MVWNKNLLPEIRQSTKLSGRAAGGPAVSPEPGAHPIPAEPGVVCPPRTSRSGTPDPERLVQHVAGVRQYHGSYLRNREAALRRHPCDLSPEGPIPILAVQVSCTAGGGRPVRDGYRALPR